MEIDFLVAGAMTALLATTAAAAPAIAQQVSSPDPKVVVRCVMNLEHLTPKFPAHRCNVGLHPFQWFAELNSPPILF